jgi:hypothetical protein
LNSAKHDKTRKTGLGCSQLFLQFPERSYIKEQLLANPTVPSTQYNIRKQKKEENERE